MFDNILSLSFFNSYYSKALKWSKLVTITGLSQAISQMVTLLCGILVIRLLPTKEYALYTLANATLGTMSVLADSGISTAVMNQAGSVWTEHLKLGEVIATGLDLRRKFATVSLIVATPILLYLLKSHGASWVTSILIVVALVPVFLTTLSNTLLEIAPKLQQDILGLQKNQIKTSLSRLILLFCTLFLFPWASASILAGGLTQIWANSNLRKISNRYADHSQKPNLLIRRDIISFVKKTAPYSIYYCLSGQISLWLISFFGTTNSIAQAGALGRLSMALNFFTILFSILVIPRFTRLQNNNKVLKYYIRIQTLLFFICAVIISLSYLFPSPALWLLGKNYSNLESELFLSITNSCIGMIAGVSFTLCTSKGWVINPKFAIPVNIISIILCALIIDVSSLKGVLIFNICVETIIAVMNISYGLIKSVQHDNQVEQVNHFI
jgi:O-antigen/teichoic acid export membrane protein